MVVGMHVEKPSQTATARAAGALVAWGNAWLSGHVGLDEAVDAVEKSSGPNVMFTTEAESPLRRGLAELRVDGMTSLRLALPIPGDPLGLTGPPELNMAAIDAGRAVIANLGDRCAGLIPAADLRGSSYSGVRWTVLAARPGEPDVPSLPEADHQLAMALREATAALVTVDDVAQGRPEIAGALAALRDEPASGLAPGYPARAHRVAAQAERLTRVVDLAHGLAGHNLTAEQMRRRAEALRLLDRAVRRAQVAAYNSAFDPVS
jgi:hypothetical protein